MARPIVLWVPTPLSWKTEMGSRIKHWNTLVREVVESSSLERFRRHVDMVFRDMV